MQQVCIMTPFIIGIDRYRNAVSDLVGGQLRDLCTAARRKNYTVRLHCRITAAARPVYAADRSGYAAAVRNLVVIRNIDDHLIGIIERIVIQAALIGIDYRRILDRQTVERLGIELSVAGRIRDRNAGSGIAHKRHIVICNSEGIEITLVRRFLRYTCRRDYLTVADIKPARERECLFYDRSVLNTAIGNIRGSRMAIINHPQIAVYCGNRSFALGIILIKI